MKRKLFVALAAVVAMTLTVPVAAAPGRANGRSSETPAVKSASDSARTKVHPHLLEAIASAGKADVQFVARIVAGTDLSAYSDRWYARPFVDPLGTTVAVGYANGLEIEKIAASDGVISLQLPESLASPQEISEPDARRQVLNAEIRIGEDSPGPAPDGWYHTGGATGTEIHASQAAWEKGYTGEGVRYMSNDSGADYCHPDLYGTWAYIDDPDSPYYGLPEIFDSFSSFIAANDYYARTSFIAEGEADYADTSTVVVPTAKGKDATLSALYTPIGSKAKRTYKLPDTSLSGEYHIGSHPDKSLADVAHIISRGLFKGAAKALRGERAGVLVVDESEPGTYDTVYVDLNYNYDFTDDAPARLDRTMSSNEAACLDYDGDGLNDVSGGLVYFISDGRTPVPTLDWYWGIPGEFFGNGDLVAFHVMDYLEGGGDHGMGTTSSATAQGVVAGSVYWGPSGSPIAGGGGLVVGPAKDAASTQNGNFYVSPFVEDAYIYAGLGYDASPERATTFKSSPTHGGSP